MLMLLIYNDKTDIRKRRKYSRSRAYDEINVSSPYAAVSIGALSCRKRGMYDRHALSVSFTEYADGLRCESDLGDEHNSALAIVYTSVYRLNDKLCFSAARHSVEQGALRLIAFVKLLDLGVRLVLSGREYYRRGIPLSRILSVRISYLLARLYRDDALINKGCNIR